jgi:hypothetical protein
MLHRGAVCCIFGLAAEQPDRAMLAITCATFCTASGLASIRSDPAHTTAQLVRHALDHHFCAPTFVFWPELRLAAARARQGARELSVAADAGTVAGAAGAHGARLRLVVLIRTCCSCRSSGRSAAPWWPWRPACSCHARGARARRIHPLAHNLLDSITPEQSGRTAQRGWPHVLGVWSREVRPCAAGYPVLRGSG